MQLVLHLELGVSINLSLDVRLHCLIQLQHCRPHIDHVLLFQQVLRVSRSPQALLDGFDEQGNELVCGDKKRVGEYGAESCESQGVEAGDQEREGEMVCDILAMGVLEGC